ncbi:MAG TPA: hypothetical protein VI197_03710 [Polyangiaceae bacterium]
MNARKYQRRLCAPALAFVSFSVTSGAWAQVTQPMYRDAGAPAANERPYSKPREGLQMAFSTGLRFPMGDATGAHGDTLAARYSYQLPLVFDIGSKVTRHVHVGGYAGFAWGAEGNADAVEEYCDDDDSDLSNDISCSTRAYKIGLQAQYHLAPAARYNPWAGYGAGVELVSQSLNDSTRRFEERTLSTALTVAKVDLGVDFRSRGGIGLGLYSEASVGRFVHSRTEINGEATYVGKVDDPAWHVWLGAGLRLVLFP